MADTVRVLDVLGQLDDKPMGGFDLGNGTAAQYVILMSATGVPYSASGGGGGGASSGTYEASPPTLSNGGTTPILVDSKGNQLFSINAGFGSASNNPLYTFLTNTITVASISNQHIDTAGNLETSLHDPLLGYGATVAQFHVADNTSPGGTGYGILTGGVAQLLNALGNLDRQRATYADNVPAVGIATGAQQLASPIATTSSSAISAGAPAGTTITVPATSGLNRGAPWKLQPNSMIVLESGTTKQEYALVTASTATSLTLTFGGTNGASLFSHTAGFAISASTFNQARDATAPDGSTGAGFAAGATFLFNSALNGGAGGWESERSANGELDGATGAGAATAVGYEFNSGAPGGGYYDRERNLQGKGLTTIAVTSGGGQGSTSVTLASAPTALGPAMPLQLVVGTYPSQTVETVYTSSSYVAGTNPVLLASAIVNAVTYTSALFDSYASNGPGLAGFTPVGVGIDEDAVYDPVTNLYYLERSATQDEVSGKNIVMESLAIYNATTGLFDRATGSTLRGLDVSLKKNNVILTTTPLAASAVYTSPWIDTTLDNTTTVNVTVFANQSGASFGIQETNDTSLSVFNSTASAGAYTSGNYTRLNAVITGRYWRVVFTNNATANTVFEIAYTTSSAPPFAFDAQSQLKVGLYSSSGGLVSTLANSADTVSSTSVLLGTTAFPFGYNGSSFDRLRTTTAYGGSNIGLLGIGVCDPNSSNAASVNAAGSDGVSATIIGLMTRSSMMAFNGTALDRLRTTQGAGLPTQPGIAAVGVVAGPIGTPNFAPSQTTIGTSASAIVAARNGVPGTGRISVTVANNGSAVVYLGGSGVTTSTGFPLAVGASVTLQTTAAVYGISGTAGQNVSAYELY